MFQIFGNLDIRILKNDLVAFLPVTEQENNDSNLDDEDDGNGDADANTNASIHRNTNSINSQKYKMHQFTHIQNASICTNPKWRSSNQ